MKILYLSKYFDTPSDYETGSRGFHLMKGLSELGYSVTVLTTVTPHLFKSQTFEPHYKKMLFDDLEVIFIKVNKFERGFSLRRALSWIIFEVKALFYIFSRTQKPDIVIASSLSILSVLTALICKFFYGSKVIFEIRDIYPLTLISEGWFSKYNPVIFLLSSIEYIGYKFSDHIIGTMPNLKQHVQYRIGGMKKVTCIPMGISEEHVVASEYLDDNFSFIPKRKFIVGYAGAIGVANDIDLILDVARELVLTNVHFVFVGDGPLKAEYLNMTNELPNITFGPVLPKKKVAGFLEKTDILIFAAKPSLRWKYGQSLNKLIDYLLAGKPIVALFEGYDEMLKSSGAGFIVPPKKPKVAANLIRDLMAKDNQELRRIGARGQMWLHEERNFKKLAKEYQDIIKTL